MIIINGLRQMCAWLCQFLYSLIAWLYELFMNLSRVELLTSKDIQPIYQRVTMILAIIMVFYVTFEFVKYVIQPETMTDKEKGASKIVQKMIIVVVLIAFVPTIFSTAYRIQNAVIGNQVFSKVILGKQNINSEAFGRNFSANLFRMFYTVNENIENLGTCEDIPCEELVSMNINNLATKGEMPHITLGLDATEKVNITTTSGTEKVEEHKIDFNPILAVGVGAFVAYMLILYCVDVGVRVAQLAYLQIIAPIPIIGYLSPKKDGIFQKWTRQCITTYLDLFIRIAIIYFVLLVCEILGNAFSDGTLLENMDGLSKMMKTFIYIALVMGLLMFAKKAPKMIGELFPSMGSASGNFGLKAKDRGLNLPGIFGAASGAAIGAGVGLATGIGQGWRRRNSLGADGKPKGIRAGILGAATGALSGTIAGAGRGLVNGSKAKKGSMMKNIAAGAKNQVKANQRFGNRAESGYTFSQQMEDRAKTLVGAKSRVEVLEEQKAPMKRYQDALERVKKTQSDMESEAEKQIKKGKGKYSGQLAAAEKALTDIQEDKDYKSKKRKSIATSQEYLTRAKAIEEDTQYQDENAKLEAMEKLLTQMTDEAVETDLQQAQLRIKKISDIAKYDFITNGEYKGKDENGNDQYATSAGLETLRTALRTDIEEYNKYAPGLYKLEENIILDAMTDGEKFDALIKGNTIKDESGNPIVDYSESGINNKISEQRNRMARITEEQEAIKRQQAGSGIGDKK